MVHEHEILVHISKAATRQNDQLYRSLTDAYLDFEPHTVHGKRPTQPHKDVSSQDAGASRLNVRGSAPSNQSSSFRSDIDNSILSTNQDSYGSFPSFLSQAEENHAPPSSRLARLEQIHQNWKAQATTTPRSCAVSKRQLEKDGISSGGEEEDVDTAFIEDTQEARSVLQSQMPDSFEMTYEDTSEDEIDEGYSELNEDAGIFTQEVALGGAETAEPNEPAERTAATEAEALQSGLEDSSPISWEDSSENELDARNIAQEISLSPDKPAERIPAAIAEDALPPRPTPSFKAPISTVIPLKSLEELKAEAEARTSISSAIISASLASSEPNPKPSSIFPDHQRAIRPGELQNIAAASRSLTAATSRRISTRLKEARGAAEASTPNFSTPVLPAPASSKPPSESNVAPEHRRSSRLIDASKLAAPFKVPTVVASRRKSTRLEEASKVEVKAPVSSKSRLNSSSAVPGPQESLRLNEASKPAASMAQHETSQSKSVHEPDHHDQPVDFSELPFSVLAPEPKIGITSPPTWPSQMTPYLTSLKTQHPALFQPTKKLHTPALDTRGWWSIDCSQWPAQAQKHFWDKICEVLEDGRLGWATSLHREVGAKNGTKDLGEVRLYCWGELVECMWLVLWECSEGRVGGMGCRWVDAWKRVVVEMG